MVTYQIATILLCLGWLSGLLKGYEPFNNPFLIVIIPLIIMPSLYHVNRLCQVQS